MKKLIFIAFALFIFNGSIIAQATTTTSPTPSASPTPAKKPIFRPTKDQITQVQKMLKEKKLYDGEADGKMNDPFRAGIKSFQKDNGLKQTGTLNRATLEKMGIILTDKQKEIPVDPNSFDTGGTSKTTTTKKRGPVFRANKEQVTAAQKMLKDKGMYSGEASGKLDDATRDGLKKYQEANGLKATGTLNQVTLEKMGVALTDKQKENAVSSAQ
jgi:peptidoglycan hydrolase-like protein with peptidoglycan-binding domain